MTRYIALCALAAAACNGSKDGDSGETGADTGDTMTMEDTGTMTETCATDGPVAITAYDVTCTGTTAEFSASTSGLTDSGWAFSQETGNAPPNFSENHPLAGTADAASCTSSLSVSLSAGTDYVAGTSSLFGCDDWYNAGVMTYAIAVADSTGGIADCVAFGDDVADMTAGTSERINEPDFDLAQCSEGMRMQ